MAEDAELVSLRLEVPKDFRTRLRTQSVRLGRTMSDLAQELMDKPLRELELEALEKAKKKTS